MDNNTSSVMENKNHLLAIIKNYEPELTRLIRNRLGIIIHRHQLTDLHKTVLEACKQFHYSPEKYLQMLAESPDQSPLLEHLVSGITVGETYFFRDANQINFLTNKLLPTLINSKREINNLSLRIWSAGCSSGEEIYTIVMLLVEALKDIHNWKLNILGTDVNTFSLQKAITGLYGEWSMRSIPEYFKKSYFKKENNQYVLTQKIRDFVRFDYLNLNNDSYPDIFNGTNSQDLIICRNVLIYFDNKSITNIMKKLSASLIPNGYLLLGASDPIDFKTANLIFHHDLGVVFSRPAVDQIADIPSNVIKTDVKKTIKTAIPRKETCKKKLSSIISTLVDEKIISKLINESKWQQIIDMISKNQNQVKNSAFLLNAKATALANIGEIQESIKLFQDSLVLDSTNKFSYFTYALVLAENNLLQEAEYALRKSIYLDHQFVEAHYQLGLLLIRNKQYNSGLKCLRNALKIAKSKNLTLNIPGPKQMTYGRLVEILGYEIKLYSALEENYYADKDTHKKES